MSLIVGVLPDVSGILDREIKEIREEDNERSN